MILVNLLYFKRIIKLVVVAHSCNPNTQEAEAGLLWVPGQRKLQ